MVPFCLWWSVWKFLLPGEAQYGWVTLLPGAFCPYTEKALKWNVQYLRWDSIQKSAFDGLMMLSLTHEARENLTGFANVHKMCFNWSLYDALQVYKCNVLDLGTNTPLAVKIARIEPQYDKVSTDINQVKLSQLCLIVSLYNLAKKTRCEIINMIFAVYKKFQGEFIFSVDHSVVQ